MREKLWGKDNNISWKTHYFPLGKNLGTHIKAIFICRTFLKQICNIKYYKGCHKKWDSKKIFPGVYSALVNQSRASHWAESVRSAQRQLPLSSLLGHSLCSSRVDTPIANFHTHIAPGQVSTATWTKWCPGVSYGNRQHLIMLWRGVHRSTNCNVCSGFEVIFSFRGIFTEKSCGVWHNFYVKQ